MSSGAEPLQIELTRIVGYPSVGFPRKSFKSDNFVEVTGYPDLDAILDKMYEDVQDPYYTGNPAETLRQVIETWDEYTALRETPDYPDLLPEYIGFDISLSNLGSNIPETPDTKYPGCPSDEVLHELIVVSKLNGAAEFSLTLRTEWHRQTPMESRGPESFGDLKGG
jgi:hypothetical protein